MKTTISGISNVIRDIEKQTGDIVAKYAELYYQEASTVTPIKSGKARGAWRKNADSQGFVVENRTPYIERLEEGYSRQAPRGITKPTITRVNRKTK